MISKTGSKIAIAVGSRGIGNIDQIIAGVVEALKKRGCHPFIVPAMGSHGSDSPLGKVQILSHLGVTDASVGAPISRSTEVVLAGKTGATACLLPCRSPGRRCNHLSKPCKASHRFPRGDREWPDQDGRGGPGGRIRSSMGPCSGIRPDGRPYPNGRGSGYQNASDPHRTRRRRRTFSSAVPN